MCCSQSRPAWETTVTKAPKAAIRRPCSVAVGLSAVCARTFTRSKKNGLRAVVFSWGPAPPGLDASAILCKTKQTFPATRGWSDNDRASLGTNSATGSATVWSTANWLRLQAAVSRTVMEGSSRALVKNEVHETTRPLAFSRVGPSTTAPIAWHAASLRLQSSCCRFKATKVLTASSTPSPSSSAITCKQDAAAMEISQVLSSPSSALVP
mmetsp:Transcript_20895/g.46699  ORF Transcript_20895/g.46699 Transcript_20895/m.46699 type:complete len:210 (-) Transcript_20895:406-1035(-)